MTRAEQLTQALNEFLGVSPDVEAAAIVSVDGLPMSSALPDEIQEDRLAAMSAALLTLGERAALGLDKGQLAQVFVEGESGNVVLMSAGGYAVLVAMTSRAAKAGLILYEMRRIADRIAGILTTEEPAPPAWDEPVQQTPEWQPVPTPPDAPETSEESPRPEWTQPAHADNPGGEWNEGEQQPSEPWGDQDRDESPFRSW